MIKSKEDALINRDDISLILSSLSSAKHTIQRIKYFEPHTADSPEGKVEIEKIEHLWNRLMIAERAAHPTRKYWKLVPA